MTDDTEHRAQRPVGFWMIRRAERDHGPGVHVHRPWAIASFPDREDGTLWVFHGDGAVTTTTVDDETIEWGPNLGESPNGVWRGICDWWKTQPLIPLALVQPKRRQGDG